MSKEFDLIWGDHKKLQEMWQVKFNNGTMSDILWKNEAELQRNVNSEVETTANLNNDFLDIVLITTFPIAC